MRLIDADALLDKWNNLSDRGRKEFDQVIMCEPTFNQIPKQVEKRNISTKSYLESLDDYFCPNCKKFLSRKMLSHVIECINFMPKYCSSCGQALKWK